MKRKKRARLAEFDHENTPRDGRPEEIIGTTETKFRALFDNVIDGVYQTTPDGKLLTVNPALVRMLGYSSQAEFLTINVTRDLYANPEQRRALTQKLEREGELRNTELVLKRKDGQEVIALENAHVVRDGLGNVLYYEGILTDITERKRAEQTLRYRVDLDRLVMSISTSFINLTPEEVDKGIDQALEAIGEFTGVDRSYIFLASGKSKSRVDNTHEWCAKGIEPQIGKMKNLPVEAFPWWRNKLEKLETIHIPSVADLPDEAGAEKVLLESHGVQSVIVVPMVHAGSLIGFIGFDSVSMRKTWHEEIIHLLKIVSEIFSSALEHKRAEKSLRDSERRFQDVATNTGDWIWEMDVQGRYIYSNAVVEHVLGYKAEEVLGKFFCDFFRPEEREQLKYAAFQAFSRGKPLASFVNRNVHKNGHIIIIETSGVPVFGADGQIVGYRGSNRDITEKKKLEERLAVLNFHGVKVNAAHTLQEIYELTLDTMKQTLGFEYASFMTTEKGSLKVVCQRGYPEPLIVRLPLDGTGKGITVKAVRMHKPILVPDIGKDEDYVEGIPDIASELAVPVEIEDKFLGVLDVESKQVGAFNEQDVTLLQILASHSATAIVNLMKREEIQKRNNQSASLMKSSAEIIRTMDLRRRLEKVAEAITEFGWRRVVIRVTGRNVEVENQKDVVTAGLTDEEREYLWVNRLPGQVWCERFGSEYERFRIGEFYHLPWSDPWVRKRFSEGTVPSRLSQEEMVDWDPQDLLYAPLRLADKRIVGIVSIDDPVDGKRPTKESLALLELFLHQAAVAIENARLIQQLDTARTQIQEYAANLEEKVEQRTKQVKEAQEQLLKSERLAAIGQVAAMVGHDLRNPLTGIRGATYYLKTRLGLRMDEKMGEMLELIERNIQYSNKIINDLLEYSIEIKLELTETDPKSIMKEALSLVEIPRNVRLFDMTRSKPRIELDIEKMKRAFVNIVRNAVDAMFEGGELRIMSREFDGNLEITFTDTGVGMPKSVLEKLWTPFSTTKAKGMGLGLAVCKRIVEAHEGKISVESIVGKGTTFKVTLPRKLKESDDEQVFVNAPESSLTTTDLVTRPKAKG